MPPQHTTEPCDSLLEYLRHCKREGESVLTALYAQGYDANVRGTQIEPPWTNTTLQEEMANVLDKDEAALRADRAAANIHEGDANTLPSTLRKCLETSKELVHEFLRINTGPAVQVALDVSLSMMRMSPRDPMGMRCIAPFFFIRLGRDQECYDFCKWWVTTGNDERYDWKYAKVSQEMMTQQNVFESVKDFQQIRDAEDVAGML